MVEYIDKDSVKPLQFEYLLPNGKTSPPVVMLKSILRIPKSDVAPIVHSKWSDEMVACRDEYGDFHFGYQCLACGAILNRTNYCGSCGAKMDLEE